MHPLIGTLEAILRGQNLAFQEALILLDAQGQIVYLNPAAERLTGLSQTNLQHRPLDEILQIYSEIHTTERLLYPINSILAQGLQFENLDHAILVSEQGISIPVELTLLNLKNRFPEGGAILILKERKFKQRSAESLPGQQLYQALMENMSEGVLIGRWIQDERGASSEYLILAINPRMGEILNLDINQVRGKPGQQVFGVDSNLLIDKFKKLLSRIPLIQFEIHLANFQRHCKVTALSLNSNHFVAIFLDLTEARMLEQAFNKGAQVFQVFFHTIAEAVIVVDLDGKVLLWNMGAERMFGYSQEEAIGKSVVDLIIPPDQQDWVRRKWKKHIRASRRRPSPLNIEFECRTKNQQSVSIELSLTLAEIENDWLSIAILRDIRQRKASQNAIQRRDAILMAVSRAAECLLRADRWQDSIQEILGSLGKATEVDRVYVFQVIRYLDKNEVLVSQLYEWVADGISPQIDNPALRDLPLQASGFGRWVEVLQRGEALYGLIEEFPLSEQELLRSQDILSLAVVPIFVANHWWGFIGFDDCHASYQWGLSEIEALRAAANVIGSAIHRQEMGLKVQQSEKRYQNLVEHLPVVVYLAHTTESGALQADYVSPNVELLCGYTPAEIQADPHLWIQRIHPEDRPQALQTFRRHLADFTAWDHEYRVLHKTGKVVWVREQAIPSYDPESGNLKAQGIIQDISIQKRRQREQEAYKLVFQALQGEQNLDRQLQNLLEAVLHAIPNAEKGSILLAENGDNLSIRTLFGYQDARIYQIRFPLTSGYAAKAFRMGTPLLIADARGDSSIRYDGEIEEIQQVKSALAAPMMLNDRAIGVITVDNCQQAHAFIPEDLHFLNQVASTAALLVENIRLLHNAQQRIQELKLIANLSYALRTADHEAEMLSTATENLMSGLQMDWVAIGLFDIDMKTIVMEHTSGSNQQLLQVIESIGEESLKNVLENKLSLVLNEQELSHLHIPFYLTSLALIPLVAEKTSIGLIFLGRQFEISPSELHLIEAIADIVANALHRARLRQRTEKQLQHLNSLYAIDRAISNRHDIIQILNVIAVEARIQLGIDALSIHLFDPQANRLHFVAGDGFRTFLIQNTNLELGEGISGIAALEKRPIYIPNIFQANDPLKTSTLCAAEGFLAHHTVPLLIQGQLKGVIEGFRRAEFDPPADWRSLFEAFADQAAIAIDNAQLFEEIQKTNLQLSIAYDATLEGWAKALEQRDRETLGHSNRVTDLTLHIASEMGIPNEQMIHIWRGTRLHDIGKMAIPDSILFKPAPLNETEWEIMRRHPVYAYDLLSPIEFLRPALEIPYFHHERWDGSGYPQGLKGEQIPLAARIFAVVDVWDALTSERPYRPAWSKEKALEYIIEQSGKQFDPKVVEIFVRILKESETFESKS